MTALPYQTFTSINPIFIGADAEISTRPVVNGPFTHAMEVRDCSKRLIAELCLTTDALVALQVRISAVLDNAAEVASWADRQIEPVA